MSQVPTINTAEDTGQSRVAQGMAVRTALLALRFYKAYLSILFAGSCRFEPTCSRYAYEAIERFGLLRGAWLGMKRLLRCQPLSRKFGYDPVPEKWEIMSSRFKTAAGCDSDGENAGRRAATSHEVHS
jgi:putative membrane protein insertion efficiency factor